MYGRAGFELLKKRVLITSQSDAFTKIDEEPYITGMGGTMATGLSNSGYNQM